MMSSRAERAEQLFAEGCNCAQAVVLAFADELPMNESAAAAVSSPFGGGMGLMRETCGAFTGALMVLGCLKGKGSPTDHHSRKELYADVRRIADIFKKNNGSLVCAELLGLRERCSAPSDAPPIQRRPCSAKVASAVHALEEVLGT